MKNTFNILVFLKQGYFLANFNRKREIYLWTRKYLDTNTQNINLILYRIFFVSFFFHFCLLY